MNSAHGHFYALELIENTYLLCLGLMDLMKLILRVEEEWEPLPEKEIMRHGLPS